MAEIGIESKGLLDILLLMDEKERSFVELRRLDLSPNTVLKRLRQAQDQGLVSSHISTNTGKRPRIRYGLTKMGGRVTALCKSHRTKYLHLRSEIEKTKKQLRRQEKEMQSLVSSLEEKINRSFESAISYPPS